MAKRKKQSMKAVTTSGSKCVPLPAAMRHATLTAIVVEAKVSGGDLFEAIEAVMPWHVFSESGHPRPGSPTRSSFSVSIARDW
ncbi:hypothetical protein [Cupriavidus laharis]|uniref:hypothetical protein n=1 Tax=Cupriavidus laharis TaxID=151654 RepID=UPI001CC4CDF9|nr:hypothetical protein [Cupriavidus laharis]